MKEIQLNPQQQEAVSHRDGPMIVISVAGSCKTMVLTERIIHLIENGLDPARLLAITFAKKAVQEIQSRINRRFNGNGDKTLVCTVHSLGYRILKAETLYGAGFRLIHDSDQRDLFQPVMEEMKIEEAPAWLMSRVSLAKNDLFRPEDLEKSNRPEDKVLAKVFAGYELTKKRKRLMDFDDLLCRPYHILKTRTENPGTISETI